jgi:hypothetical protein
MTSPLLIPSLSLRVSRLLQASALSLMFLVPAALVGQQVPYTAPGFISISSSLPPIYNGPYVLQTTDFGFLWLNTTSLQAGLVEAEAKCDVHQPPSSSNIYVQGDCNGISNISSSGNSVLVRQFNSQCGAATLGCNGPSTRGPARLTFGLGGNWPYLGDQGEIPDSTQTTDPQGRTWMVQPTDSTSLNFLWTASGNPNSPPIASAFATNLSAASRADKTNYYGDKWQLRDTSTSSPTSVTWDFNYTGSFSTDESGAESVEGLVVGYFPCDPSGLTRGDFHSGSNCRASLGLSNPPPPGAYQFAMLSANAIGPSSNTFTSTAIAFTCPEAILGGYSNFTGTCAKTGGVLNVGLDGTADASGSTGNLGEAAANWTFTFPSGSPVGLQGLTVATPPGANAFSLTITYPGGYQATASGSVTYAQTLVPDFSTPNTVIRGSQFTVLNQMQKAPTTTLNSVDYLFTAGACGAPPAIPPNPLPSTFLITGGTARVTAPASVGGYCMYLKFNYTPQNSSQTSAIAARAITVIDWTPSPAMAIYLDSGKVQLAPFQGGAFNLMAGTPYFLFDEEPAPPSGSPYPGAQWTLVTSSGSVALGSTSTQTGLMVVFPTACASGCSLKLSVGAAVQQVPVSIIGCSQDGSTLCLNAGRFKVQATWMTADNVSGAGHAVSLTGDTGYFWFFSSNNVEMVVKVVDGRAVNSYFWVFAGGLTNVNVVLTVTDTQTGAVRVYRNPQGTPFQPIQDTSAFQSSATLDPAEASAAGFENVLPGDGGRSASRTAASQIQSAAAGCTVDATTLCLNSGRFSVQAQWTSGDGSNGAGQAVALTGDTGYFWFFTPNNVELVVKVVDGCVVNSSHWVFAGGLTDVAVVLTVTDTQTGAVKVYRNPQGTPFQPIQDTSAFTCP